MSLTERTTMRHPESETLLDYVGGELDLPMRVLLETHLELCPGCHEETARLAVPGGRLLAETAANASTAPPPALWNRLEAAIAAPEPRDRFPAEIPLPAAARQELAADVRPRWWRWGLGGARMALLATDPSSGGRLAVGRMPGGMAFPRHTHEGWEHAVVLAGGYDDERGEFLAGDWAAYEPGSEHGPDTLDGDDCWILFRVDAPVRFHGWRGRLQRLFG